MLEVEGNIRYATRAFAVACRYGTTTPGRSKKSARKDFEAFLVAGHPTGRKVYGIGIEPEQHAPGFKAEKLLGVCRRRK